MSGGSAPSSARSSWTVSRSNPAIRTGKLFVLAGPSRVGKGSIVRKILAQHPEGLSLSGSLTEAARQLMTHEPG